MKDELDKRSDDRDVELKGDHLSGLRFDFIVSGGIAGIESPKLIRELRRYGANIRPVMTESAHQFITPTALEWAAKNSVVSSLSGTAEHITQADAVIVSPATLDFISKISLGLADSPALTLVQSILGRRPLFIFPTMHESLWQNPIFRRNLDSLKRLKQCFVIDADFSEFKRKALQPELAAAQICHAMSRSSMRDKKIAITLGATRSYFDDVRFLSNISTGAMGLSIAQEFYLRGANVHIVAGAHSVSLPSYLKNQSVETAGEMAAALDKLDKVDVMILSAAVLDFDAKNSLKEKKSSDSNWTVELKPSLKIIDKQKKSAKVLVGFKLESRVSVEKMQETVVAWNKTKKCDIVVCNRLQDISADKHKTYIFNSAKRSFLSASSKVNTAEILFKEIESQF